jgi:excisionase family DNA binding protein
MKRRLYSTREAARAVGITRATLQAWIAAGKITAPKAHDFGNVRVRLWSQSDIAGLRRAKLKIYWKHLVLRQASE